MNNSINHSINCDNTYPQRMLVHQRIIMSFRFQDLKIKKGKVFLHENQWIVSVPGSDGRTAFLAYSSESEAQLANEIFNRPLTLKERKRWRDQKELLEAVTELREQAKTND